MRLSVIQDYVDVVQGIVTILAIVFGGWWSLYRFGLSRERRPRAVVNHEVFVQRLSGGKHLIRDGIRMRNAGKTLIRWTNAKVWVQRVLPCDSAEMNFINARLDGSAQGEGDWPLVGRRELTNCQIEIEPDESDAAWVDFIVDGDLVAFSVYSHVENVGKKPMGWTNTTTHEVKSYTEKGNAETKGLATTAA